MAALDGILEALRIMDSPLLGVHPERCIMVRNRNAQCLRCANVCASGAISFSGECLEVNPRLCIGCGTCATACPTCALEAIHPTDEHLLEQASRLLAEGREELVVACGRFVDSVARKKAREAKRGRTIPPEHTEKNTLLENHDVLQVTCLGRLDESFYVEAAARGARRVTLACLTCDTCKHVNGGTLSVDVAESACSLLESRGYELDVEYVEDLPSIMKRTSANSESKPTYSKSRREFFGSVGHTARKAALASTSSPLEQKEPQSLPKVGENGSLPQFLPTRRNRLFNSLRQLGTSKKDRTRTRLWGQVCIDTEQCSSCRMCAVFCPTGALVKYETEDGGIGIAHRSALCVQCRLCENICKEQALSVDDEVSLSDFETGRVIRIPMKPLSWIPNKPDSIFKKVNGMFGDGKHNSYF